MAHRFDSGFSVRKPAWHGLTNVLTASPDNFKQARKAAGIEWEVEEGPLFGYELAAIGGKVFDPRAVLLDDAALRKMSAEVRGLILKGKIMDALTAMGAVLVEDKKRTLRSDTGKTLGTPGTDYEIISNDEIGEICDALTKAMRTGPGAGKVEWEALVSLEGGKSIVATLILDEPVKLPKDTSQILPLLVVSTRNDGTGSARAQTTTIRVICANTRSLSDSQSDANGTVFSFRHGASWKERLDEAVETLKGLRTSFKAEMDFARELCKVPVNETQTREWLERFLPYPLSAAEVSTDRQLRNIDEARLTVRNILRSDTCKGIEHTAFGLLSAGDEFLDHYRALGANGKPRSYETATKRAILVPEPMKRRQVEIIADVVGIPALAR